MKYFILLICCYLLLPVKVTAQDRGSNGANKYTPDDRSWVDSANQRIQKYRKADISISVINKDGKPIQGASVTISQTKQAFNFGSFVRGRLLLNEGDSTYSSFVKSHFNLVVPADFQWINWNDPVRGNANKKTAINALQWCKNNGIAVKGHYLSWAPIRDYNLVNKALTFDEYKDPLLYKKALFNYIDDVLTQTRGYIQDWDAINHLAAKNQKGQLTDERAGKLSMDDYMGNTVYKELIDKVKSTDPNIGLYVNEDNIFSVRGVETVNDSYYKKITALKDQGVAIDGIGFMSHFRSNDLASMGYIKTVFNKYSQLGLPMRVTEFDVLFGKKGDNDPMTDAELLLQKQYTEDYMRMCYSIPSINAFIIWGFWAGDDWYPSAALYNKDWTIKPNGAAWEQLVLHEWKTNTSGKTDGNGRYTVNGFLGDYKLTVKYPNGKIVEKTFSLDKNGKTLTIN